MNRGEVYSKNYINEHKGIYSLYSSQTLNNGEIGKIDHYDYDGDYLTWTTDGVNAGTIFRRHGKFSITNVCGLLTLKDEYKNILDLDYIYYYLSIILKNYVNYGTSIPKLMNDKMSLVEIKVPICRKTQQKIVNILDKMSDYCNNINDGLEKELQLREKQYKYYLNKLLTF